MPQICWQRRLTIRSICWNWVGGHVAPWTQWGKVRQVKRWVIDCMRKTSKDQTRQKHETLHLIIIIIISKKHSTTEQTLKFWSTMTDFMWFQIGIKRKWGNAFPKIKNHTVQNWVSHSPQNNSERKITGHQPTTSVQGVSNHTDTHMYWSDWFHSHQMYCNSPWALGWWTQNVLIFASMWSKS